MYNTTIENILSRRSCRSYLSNQIDEKDLDIILKCGICAPSAMNEQPWDILCVQDKVLLDEISENCKAFLKNNDPELVEFVTRPRLHIFHNAPTVIFISGDKNNKYSVIDCSLAVENILISAHSLGISSCAIGLVADFFNGNESVQYIKKFNIPKDYRVYLAIALGYAGSVSQYKHERDESKVRMY